MLNYYHKKITMRELSYGEKENGMLDKLLFFLRTRVITSKLTDTAQVKKVLDLGCGYNGYFLMNIIGYFPSLKEAAGVDLSVTPNLGVSKLTLVQGDLNDKLPFTDNTFDIVFSTAVLEHLENYDLALKEMYRVINDGGRLFLTTPAPSAKPVLEFLSYKLGLIEEHEIRDHKKYFSRNELCTLFKDLGFREVRVMPFQLGLNTIAVCRK